MHVAVWGAFASSQMVADTLARITLDVTVQNDAQNDADVKITTRVLGPDKGDAGKIDKY